jgi:beta-phosphoglucomutase-like phosphatase (HAD superfamily)
VIFDLDGVLVDSEPAHQTASRRLIAPTVLSDEDYRHFVGASLEVFVSWIRQRYQLEASQEQIAQRYDALVTEEVIAAKLPPFDGAIELLVALR